MNYNKPDDYTVPDFPYNPEEYGVKPVKDRFDGFRALEAEDYNLWQRAIEDANS